jgi:hypothetical protein
MASPHGCWLSAGGLQLKRVKRISVIFSILDLKWISAKMHLTEIKGYLFFLVGFWI